MEKINQEFNPLVSIIIPVYNGANFMREAIDSALAQTYKNIEIIVVNDGSVDNTDEIAKSYGNKIKYFKKENGGVATALNFAIKKADGEYISWLSHDDLYYPNKIDLQIQCLRNVEKNKIGKTIVFSYFDILNMETGKKEKRIADLINFTEDEPFYTYSMLDAFFSSKIGGCTLLIPKNLFEELGFFDENYKTIQDYLLFVKFFKSGVNFIYLNNALVTSRHHKKQDTHRLHDKHIVELNYLYKLLFNDFVDEFRNMPFWQFNHFLNIIKNRTLDKVYAHMISGWANGDHNKDKPIIWMYWENKTGKNTPDYIRLCWKTIIFHNRFDFQIKILSEDDINEYVGDLKDNYKLLSEIAHKADYLRFNLLFKYGGIWLDSDFICFRSLKNVQKILQNKSFVATGYLHENGKYFPIISFLASKKNSTIVKKVIDKMDLFLEKKVKNGIQPEWDEFAGWNLAETLIESKGEFHMFPIDYFYVYKTFASENHSFEFDFNRSLDFLNKRNIFAFGQSMANSNRSDNFKNLNEEQLLSADNFLGDLFRLCISFDYIDSQKVTRGKKIQKKTCSYENKMIKMKNFYLFIKNHVRIVLRNIIFKISPTFRMLSGNRHRMSVLIQKVENMEKVNQSNSKAILEKIDNIEKINDQKIAVLLKKFESLLTNVVPNYSGPSAFSENFNLLGEKINISNDHKSTTVYHKSNINDFFKKIKKNILKTDVVLDIGCGIRPQTFFVPKVHICVEPFGQYRDVIKPLFPNRAHFIFLRDDALTAIKTLDDNSVDTVFMIDLIEHLKKDDGFALLKEADRVARKQVIVFTPLGFYPMHYKEVGMKDAWGLNGTDVQEHKSGWLPDDFGESWDFHICEDCHEAFLPEEKAQGKKYSALMAIKTKRFDGFLIAEETPTFVKDVYKERVTDGIFS